MTGDLKWYHTSEEVSAHLVANADGSVPERGAGLEIRGENPDHPEVGAVSAPDNFVGTLVEVPPDYDETATFAAGEVVGEVTVLLQHPIAWMVSADATLTAGTDVVHDANGVRTYDPVDTGADDQPDYIIGPVWYSGSDGAGTAGKVAVVRQNK